MKIINIMKIIFGILILLTFISCEDLPEEPVYDNPLDPENLNYEQPVATVTDGPTEGETIQVNTVSFSWNGRKTESQFSYMLEGVDNNWSSWSLTKSESYNNLSDETEFTFKVKEKYQNGVEQETPTLRNFTIDYPDPLAVIVTGPDEGETISTNATIFTWTGRQSDSQFKFKLEDFDYDWSDWTNTTEKTYNYLDEGNYTFLVLEKYITGDEQENATERTFTVNAITGPAFVMKKQLVETNINSDFSIDIIAEEVTNLIGCVIQIEFETDFLELTNIEEMGFLNSGNSQGTTFISSELSYANTEGIIEINSTRIGGDPPGVNGSGIIAELTFHTQTTGTTNISFIVENCIMRDTNNQNIQIINFIGTLIEIE